MKNSLSADRPASGLPIRDRAPVRAFRIVAADDDPAACQVYREALPALGYETSVAACDAEVRELCRTITPDLLVYRFHALIIARQVRTRSGLCLDMDEWSPPGKLTD